MSWIDDLPPGCCGWRTWQAPPGVELEVFCCRGEEAHPQVLVTAGVHGDEYEGPAAVLALPEILSPHRLRGTLIAVPVANPSAFAAGTRTNPEDSRNLARTFPGNAAGGPTEQLAAAFFQQLSVPADYLIDLHSGGVEFVFLPMACFYGEPAIGNPSFAAARAFGLGALWQLPETEGVLSYEVWRREKTAIGAEYRGAGQLSGEGMRDYRNGILACLQHWGLLSPAPRESRTTEVFTGDWQLASATGIFVASCRIGDAVSKGTALAIIAGKRGQVLQEFVSPYDGVVLGLRSKAYIRETNWGVLVGSRIA
jgi:predicted deacylase